MGHICIVDKASCAVICAVNISQFKCNYNLLAVVDQKVLIYVDEQYRRTKETFRDLRFRDPISFKCLKSSIIKISVVTFALSIVLIRCRFYLVYICMFCRVI